MHVQELTAFFNAIREDNRILPSHIAVYMALFECWNQRKFQNPVPIQRREIMTIAKINGLATYHRCIRDLHQFGYIRYIPSYNAALSSQVVITVKG